MRLLLLLPLLAACDTAGTTLRNTDTVMGIVYAVMLLVLILGFGGWRDFGGIGSALKQIAGVLALFAVLIVGYTYKDDLGSVWSRVKGEVMPRTPQVTSDGRVTLRRNDSNHFATVARVNGRPTVFMVDTGASQVVIPYSEALRLGFNEEDLSFTARVSTANGTAFVAPVTIRALEVGNIVVNDVRAAVSSPGDLDQGLLGLTFLDRLSGYRFEGDRLTLEQ